jgi:hypothetical protein
MQNIILNISFSTVKNSFDITKTDSAPKKLSVKNRKHLRKLMRDLNSNPYSKKRPFDFTFLFFIAFAILMAVVCFKILNVFTMIGLGIACLLLVFVVTKGFNISHQFSSFTKKVLEKHVKNSADFFSLTFKVSPFFKIFAASSDAHNVLATLKFHPAFEEFDECEDTQGRFLASTRDNLDDQSSHREKCEVKNFIDDVSINQEIDMEICLDARGTSLPRREAKAISVDDNKQPVLRRKSDIFINQDDTFVRYGTNSRELRGG